MKKTGIILAAMILLCVLCSISAIATSNITIGVLNTYNSKQTEFYSGSNAYINITNSSGSTICSFSVKPSDMSGANSLSCPAITDTDDRQYIIYKSWGDWTTQKEAIYYGKVANNTKILTQYYENYIALLNITLRGANNVGRKIIVRQDYYQNQDASGGSYDLRREQAIGYTDENGQLLIGANEIRQVKVYFDNVSNYTLIYDGMILWEEYLEDLGFYSIDYDLDQHENSAMFRLSLGEINNDYNPEYQYVYAVARPVRVNRTTDNKVLCRGMTPGSGYDSSGQWFNLTKHADFSFFQCRMPNATSVTVQKNYRWAADLNDANNVMYWNYSGDYPDFNVNISIYTGNVIDTTTLLSNSEGYYNYPASVGYYSDVLRFFTLNLTGSNKANRKVIVRGDLGYNEDVGGTNYQFNNSYAIGYTNSQGIIVLGLNWYRYYKIYLDDDTNENNLIFAGQTSPNGGTYYFRKDALMLNLDTDKPSYPAKIIISASSTSMAGVFRAVRVFDSSGRKVCQSATSELDRDGSMICRLNEGGKYTIVYAGTTYNSNDGNGWYHSLVGTAYRGNVKGPVEVLTYSDASYRYDNNHSIYLGSAYANQTITMYNVNAYNDPDSGSQFNLSRIGCQGYLDDSGNLFCNQIYYRRFQGYLGNRTTGTKLFDYSTGNGPAFRYIQSFNNTNVPNSAIVHVDDRDSNDVYETDDGTHYEPVEIYDSSGYLVCSGRTNNAAVLTADYECLIEKGKDYYVFIATPDSTTDSVTWYLIYYGRINGETFLRWDGNTFGYNGLVEVFVHDGQNNPVVNTNVNLSLETGLRWCSGWTKTDGRMLCNVNDYSGLAASASYPRYTVSVAGQNLELQLSNSGSDILMNATGIPRMRPVGLSRFHYLDETYDSPANAREIAYRNVSVAMGSYQSGGALASLRVQVQSEGSNVGAGKTVVLTRSGTSNYRLETQTDANSIATFSVDPYYSYDVRTDYGSKINIYLQPAETRNLLINRATKVAFDEIYTKPSLLTLSGSLKNKTTGGLSETASFKIKIRDGNDDLWYDFNTNDGFCFANKVYKGSFSFILGGQHPLYLVKDKLYSMDIDVYVSDTCAGAASDTFTTYFKG